MSGGLCFLSFLPILPTTFVFLGSDPPHCSTHSRKGSAIDNSPAAASKLVYCEGPTNGDEGGARQQKRWSKRPATSTSGCTTLPLRCCSTMLFKQRNKIRINYSDEREMVLKLARENDRFRIQEDEDRKRIQHLLSITKPVQQQVWDRMLGSIDTELLGKVTFFKDREPRCVTQLHPGRKKPKKSPYWASPRVQGSKILSAPHVWL